MRPKNRRKNSVAVTLPMAPSQQIDSAQPDEVAPNLTEARRLIGLVDAEQLLSGDHPTAALCDMTEKLIAHAGVLIATELGDHWLAAGDLIGKANQLRRVQASGSLPKPHDADAKSTVTVAPLIAVAPAAVQVTTAKHERVIGLLVL